MECYLSCPHRDTNLRNNNRQCDYSCHPRTCQCGSCHHGHSGQCENPNHSWSCHCGDKEKPRESWHGIAE